jgi:hypothetical protein
MGKVCAVNAGTLKPVGLGSIAQAEKPKGHCNNDGVDRPAPAAQNLGVSLHLHVRDLARRFDGFDSTTFFR